MNSVRVRLAVSSGLSAVCATCTKYWKARDAGIPGDRCLSQTACGSPLAGHAFQEYDGPIRNMERWCFVCGEESTHAAVHDETGKRFGLCTNHVKLVEQIQPMGRKNHRIWWDDPLPPRVVTAGGKLISVDKLLGRPKKSLFEAIMEVENYYEEKRRRV